jgi:hypothetical protein
MTGVKRKSPWEVDSNNARYVLSYHVVVEGSEYYKSAHVMGLIAVVQVTE